MSETATEGVLYEKMFLEISQNSQENTRAFLMKPEACNFIKKETLSQVFSCEFCEISKKHLFYRTPLGDYFYIVEETEPFYIRLTGGAGLRKSFLIDMIT